MTRQVHPPTETSPEIGRSISAGGIATNYHDAGDGPPVLLIHGSGPGVSAFANWRLAIPALSRQFRVIAPDALGFGFTERQPGITYALRSWLDHLVSFLDALGLPRVSVVGNSFGGAMGLHLALEHPERIDRLVLMGPAGGHFKLTPGLDAVWGYEPSVVAMQQLIDTFVFDPSQFDPALAQLRYQASIRPGVHESYAAMFPAPRQRWVDALAADDDRVRGLRNEVLILHGRDDRVIPVTTSIALAQAIERSQLHVFGRCGHWVQLEQAARFHRLVADFLSEPRA